MAPRTTSFAQTYLRQWADPSSGMLRGYGKRTGREFPCAPKDVCREWDWDVESILLRDNPRLLGDYRKIFEPQWKTKRHLTSIVEDGTRAGEVINRIRALIKKAPPRKDRLENQWSDRPKSLSSRVAKR